MYLKKDLKFQVLLKCTWVQVQVLWTFFKSTWVQVQVLWKVLTSTQVQVQVQVLTHLWSIVNSISVNIISITSLYWGSSTPNIICNDVLHNSYQNLPFTIFRIALFLFREINNLQEIHASKEPPFCANNFCKI